MRAIIVSMGLAAMLFGTAAPADIVFVHGDAADYEIRRDTNTNVLTTDDGGDTVLDVIADPDFDAQERRAIFEFDLSLLGGLQSIDAASITITLAGVDVFPSQDVDLYGSTDNRSAAVFQDDDGATDEFDAPSYTLLASNFAPVANPFDTDVAYTADITGFLQDRYDDYVNGSGDSFVLFRIQTQALVGTSFYDFYSGDAAMGFKPIIEVDGTIPAPGTLVILAGFAIGRRRRRSS